MFPKLHPLTPVPGPNKTIRGSGAGQNAEAEAAGMWRNSASFCPTCAVSVVESLMRLCGASVRRPLGSGELCGAVGERRFQLGLRDGLPGRFYGPELEEPWRGQGLSPLY